MTPLIADTSGLYALADRNDPHHARAAGFLKAHVQPGCLLVSHHVFDETMTLVKARLGMRAALELGLRLRNSRFVEMVVFSAAEEGATWRLFSRHTGQDWSYTDCACLVLAQARGVQRQSHAASVTYALRAESRCKRDLRVTGWHRPR